METVNLNAELFRQLSVIADDEILMKKALKAIRRLAKERLESAENKKEAYNPDFYTMEDVNSWLDEGEAEDGGTPSDEVFTQMEKKYPWLCK